MSNYRSRLVHLSANSVFAKNQYKQNNFMFLISMVRLFLHRKPGKISERSAKVHRRKKSIETCHQWAPYITHAPARRCICRQRQKTTFGWTIDVICSLITSTWTNLYKDLCWKSLFAKNMMQTNAHTHTLMRRAHYTASTAEPHSHRTLNNNYNNSSRNNNKCSGVNSRV